MLTDEYLVIFHGFTVGLFLYRNRKKWGKGNGSIYFIPNPPPQSWSLYPTKPIILYFLCLLTKKVRGNRKEKKTQTQRHEKEREREWIEWEVGGLKGYILPNGNKEGTKVL